MQGDLRTETLVRRGPIIGIVLLGHSLLAVEHDAAKARELMQKATEGGDDETNLWLATHRKD
jgi:hypothetical protein